jgi:hypothetical protein
MKRYNDKHNLPKCAIDYIDEVVRKVRYKKNIRADVRAELIGHFEDALKDCTTDDDCCQSAEELITEFGDVKMLAKLIRRGKKRCRPMWKKVLIRTFQVFLCLIAFLIFRGLTLTIGKPTISVDYVQWLNEFVRDGRDESQNAYSNYVKAMELMPEEVPEILKESIPLLPENMTAEDERIIADFLKANEPALEELRKGARKAYCWVDYTPGEQKTTVNKTIDATVVDKLMPDMMAAGVIEKIMPNLSKYKNFARRLGLRGNWRMYKGDFDGALNDAVMVRRFGDQMLGQGLIIEQLVGIAINAMGSAQIRFVLSGGEFSAEELKVLQSQLEGLGVQESVLVDFEAEKAFMYDEIQRGFTDDGKGNGRVLKRGLPHVISDYKSALKGVFLFDFPDRRQVLAEVEKLYDQFNEAVSKSPLEAKQYKFDISEAAPFMLKIQVGPVDKLRELSWRLITDREALLATVSILRYEKETGAYPESLEKLVDAGYLDKLPQDPFSGGALVYKKTDDGFTLYSVGLDMVDDGGVQGTDDKHRRIWSDDGDAVFWPTE